MRIVLAAAVFFVGCGAPSRSSVIHMPATGCPPGAKQVRDYFTEKGGTKEHACLMPNGDGSIDMLKPGESMRIEIHFDDSSVRDKI